MPIQRTYPLLPLVRVPAIFPLSHRWVALAATSAVASSLPFSLKEEWARPCFKWPYRYSCLLLHFIGTISSVSKSNIFLYPISHILICHMATVHQMHLRHCLLSHPTALNGHLVLGIKYKYKFYVSKKSVIIVEFFVHVSRYFTW